MSCEMIFPLLDILNIVPFKLLDSRNLIICLENWKIEILG